MKMRSAWHDNDPAEHTDLGETARYRWVAFAQPAPLAFVA